MAAFLLLAILPGLYWDNGPETASALKQAGVDRVYVPAARKDAWAGQGIDAVVVDIAKLTKLAKPGVQYRQNVAAATTVPWMDANGWQFEREFYSKQEGPTVLNEWVFLLGGLDQGVPIPSLSWLVGMRTKEGAEFGIGPNITPAGVALAVAAGVTFRAGVVNVPMNFAVVPSKYGTRVSVLTGFVLRH